MCQQIQNDMVMGYGNIKLPQYWGMFYDNSVRMITVTS